MSYLCYNRSLSDCCHAHVRGGYSILDNDNVPFQLAEDHTWTDEYKHSMTGVVIS